MTSEQASRAGRLDGEVAIVTGATSGLGREIARLFASEGAKVVVTGRDTGRGHSTVALARATGGEAAFVSADLCSESGCRILMRRRRTCSAAVDPSQQRRGRIDRQRPAG